MDSLHPALLSSASTAPVFSDFPFQTTQAVYCNVEPVSEGICNERVRKPLLAVPSAGALHPGDWHRQLPHGPSLKLGWVHTSWGGVGGLCDRVGAAGIRGHFRTERGLVELRRVLLGLHWLQGEIGCLIRFFHTVSAGARLEPREA